MSDTDLDQRVREKAYHLWEAAGRPADREEEFWQQARMEVAPEDVKVDVAMEDTFPASDPPSHSGITGPGTT